MTELGIGILATGGIAELFVTDLQHVPGVRAAAVGSRSLERAQAFADRHGIAGAHGSYEALVADPTVDIVYVATPHSEHFSNVTLALDAGKHVLCEKAFTHNELEARIVLAQAKAKGLLVCEAMWMRFLPHMRRVKSILREGEVGDVRFVQADFGFRARYNPTGRLFDPALAGGALLDVGVYPVALAQWLLVEPEVRHADVTRAPTGVDETITMSLRDDQGRVAHLLGSIALHTPTEAVIVGTKGRVKVLGPWYRPQSAGLEVVTEAGRRSEQVEHRGNGLHYQMVSFVEALRGGKDEVPEMPHADTLGMMRIMDRVRATVGLSFPNERRA